jgi:hypothetical protein
VDFVFDDADFDGAFGAKPPPTILVEVPLGVAAEVRDQDVHMPAALPVLISELPDADPVALTPVAEKLLTILTYIIYYNVGYFVL